MKFVQFYKDGKITLGVKLAGGIVDLSAFEGMPKTMKELCERSDDERLLNELANITAGALYNEGDIAFAPVVTGMEKIVCIGLNYIKHAEECHPGQPLPTEPTVFAKFGNALAAHGEEVKLPQSKKVDYEAELVLIMGEGGKIFAYTTGNDLSARDWQNATSQWICGKTYDKFAPIGPYAVDAVSVKDRHLAIECRVNGEVRQSDFIDQMIFTPEQIVQYLMPRIPLKPGDIIFTGTPSGVMLGYPENAKNWLKAGDTVEVSIEGIGVLKNKLV